MVQAGKSDQMLLERTGLGSLAQVSGSENVYSVELFAEEVNLTLAFPDVYSAFLKAVRIL